MVSVLNQVGAIQWKRLYDALSQVMLPREDPLVPVNQQPSGIGSFGDDVP